MLGMHNHHIKNPLFRTFTEEENKKIEDVMQKEIQEELIQERLSFYQLIKKGGEESKKSSQSQVQLYISFSLLDPVNSQARSRQRRWR